MLLCPQPLLRIKCTCQEESDCHGNSGMGGEPEDIASTHEPDLYLPMREAPPTSQGKRPWRDRDTQRNSFCHSHPCLGSRCEVPPCVS